MLATSGLSGPHAKPDPLLDDAVQDPSSRPPYRAPCSIAELAIDTKIAFSVFSVPTFAWIE